MGHGRVTTTDPFWTVCFVPQTSEWESSCISHEFLFQFLIAQCAVWANSHNKGPISNLKSVEKNKTGLSSHVV